MKPFKHDFNTLLFIIACLFTSSWKPTLSSKVVIYESINYTGLILETHSNASCTSLPRRALGKTMSLKTYSCLMIYTGENCTMTSIKIEAGVYSDLSSVTHEYGENFGNALRSFHRCSQDVGSSDAVHVKFYEGKDLVAEYQNICDCVTLPNLTNAVTRLDNYGTCLNLYIGPFGLPPSCTESYHTIKGGTSYLSEHLQNLTHYGSSWNRIMAFSPCSTELTKCMKLQATVIKFEVNTDPATVSQQSSSSDISISITTTFRNNGSATVSEEYTAKKSITEVTETLLTKGFSAIENWTVESGVTTEFSVDIPMVAKSTVTASLTSAYTRLENSSWQESELKRRETATEFSVSQKIEIMPCTLYNVNSFVKVINNYPVNYKVYSKISGRIDDRKLTTEELKNRLNDLEYVRDYDNYSIVACGQGIMNLDYGMETVIDGEGVPIDNCWSNWFNSDNFALRNSINLYHVQSSLSNNLLCSFLVLSLSFCINFYLS